MKEHIRRYDRQAEYFIDEGCFVNELSNSAEDTAVSIAQARVPVGVSTRWHRLNGTVERYVILSGKGLVEIGDLPMQHVAVGDVVVIPAGCRQRITAVGADELVFLAICSPRFNMDEYEDLEE
ncbi:MAG: cupin domain-containing protein [Pseudomonas sp.]